MHDQLGLLASELLVRRAGPQALLDYFEQHVHLGLPEESFEKVFGLTHDEFYEEFAAWRGNGFPAHE